MMEETGICLEKIKYLLDPGQHSSDGLVNIVTGMVVTLYVHNAVKLGQTQMDSFQKTWPGVFMIPFPKL